MKQNYSVRQLFLSAVNIKSIMENKEDTLVEVGYKDCKKYFESDYEYFMTNYGNILIKYEKIDEISILVYIFTGETAENRLRLKPENNNKYMKKIYDELPSIESILTIKYSEGLDVNLSEWISWRNEHRLK